MATYELDPISDPRWLELLERHPQASIFHTPGWLEALRRTYGYRPVVATTTPPGQPLENGIALCHINSWLTGSRLVSLPFSDHCQPLAGSDETLRLLFQEVTERARDRCRYVELRPLTPAALNGTGMAPFVKGEEYDFHQLDLRPALETLYRNFHKNCIQRKIQRAEREQLTCEAGRSEPILEKFYYLLELTRRRHQIPPQPMSWFRNLIDRLGEGVALYVACKDSRPVASIFTLAYRRTLVYKYGCSDARFHNLGGMPWLFWLAIKDAKQQGAEEFDLGRTDLDNAGLIAFKNHLGAARSRLTYCRYPGPKGALPRPHRARQLARNALALMPDSLRRAAGEALYKHIG